MIYEEHSLVVVNFDERDSFVVVSSDDLGGMDTDSVDNKYAS